MSPRMRGGLSGSLEAVMKEFQLPLWDDRRVRDAAVELLSRTASLWNVDGMPWGPDAADLPVVRLRAAWLGSPGALGALGLHRADEVTVDSLTTALHGRHAVDGSLAREGEGEGDKLSLASLELSFEAPEAIVREWELADPSGKEEIERDLIASAGSALERLRPTMLARRSVSDTEVTDLYAHGLAAAAMVEGEPGSPLCVRVVVLGVEHQDGLLVAPIAAGLAEAERDAWTAESAALVARRAAPDHQNAQLVGHDGAWVPDPLNPHRHTLGKHAGHIDELATAHGEQLVRGHDGEEVDDDWLERRFAELSPPFEHLDPQRAALARHLDQEATVARERLYAAQEDSCVVDARLSEYGYRAQSSSSLESAAQVLRERVSKLGEELLWAEEGLADPSASYLDDWVYDHQDEASEWLAIARERAIRQRLRELDAPEAASGAGRTPEAPPNAKEIGSGNRATNRRVRPLGGGPVVLSDISAPRFIDSLRGVIDDARLAELERLAFLLSSWVEQYSDEWVQRRHAELGDPGRGLDRSGTRELLRLETTMRPLQQRINTLWLKIAEAGPDATRWLEEDGRLEAVDPSLEVACQEFTHLYTRLKELESHMSIAHADARNRWLVDGYRLVRAVVYADEFEIRRERSLQEEVEWSVVDPPAHIVGLIGSAPDPAAPERGAWEALTRDIEYKRLATEADLRDGREPQRWRLLSDQRDLDQRIDALREARGVPSLAHEAAIDAPGYDV